MMEHHKRAEVMRILNVGVELDYHAANFQKLLTDPPGGRRDVDQFISFVKIEESRYDFYCIVHHKKILAKYTHILKRGDNVLALYGKFQFFVVQVGSVNPDRVQHKPILTIEFDQNGDVELEGERDVTCSPNQPFAVQTRNVFAMHIITAVQEDLVEDF